MINSVFPSLVTSLTRLPFLGSPSELLAQLNNISAIKDNGVHLDVSALGIHFRFIGVSNVMGNNAKTLKGTKIHEDFACGLIPINSARTSFNVHNIGIFTREFSGMPDLGSANDFVN